MSLKLPGFPMKFYDNYIDALANYTECNVQVGGEDTVFVNCSANVVKCMEVVAITDLYYFSDPDKEPPIWS